LADELLELGFGKTEVEGFADDLIDGGLDELFLFGEGGNLASGDDEGAVAAAEFDEAVAFEELVGLGDGEGVEVEFSGEVADGGELGVGGELAAGDPFLELLDHLPVDGESALGVEVEEHRLSDILQYITWRSRPSDGRCWVGIGEVDFRQEEREGLEGKAGEFFDGITKLVLKLTELLKGSFGQD